MPHKITLSNIRRRNYMKEYIEFQRKITKGGGTSTSYRITIPEEIIHKMEVTSGDKITWRVYDKNNEITILFPKESSQTTKKTSINIDNKPQKPTKESKAIIIATTQTNNRLFSIILQKNPHLQIAIINNSTQKQVTTLGASKREEEEIQNIISNIKPCNSEEEIKELLTQYR